MTGRIYKFIWSRWTGRPLTYSMRQTAREKPAVIVLASLAVGIVAGRLLPAPYWPLVILPFAAGALFGHLWWTTSGEHIKHAKDFKRDH